MMFVGLRRGGEEGGNRGRKGRKGVRVGWCVFVSVAKWERRERGRERARESERE